MINNIYPGFSDHQALLVDFHFPTGKTIHNNNSSWFITRNFHPDFINTLLSVTQYTANPGLDTKLYILMKFFYIIST